MRIVDGPGAGGWDVAVGGVEPYNSASVTLSFYKYEGLGNDFLIVEKEALGGASLTAELAIALCDRHRGIGADGVLTIDVADPSMGVINSDGSVPEMCGNGIRCAALHLARRAFKATLEVTIQTLAGPHPCVVSNQPGAESVAVQMAPPSLSPPDLPLIADAPWIDHPLDVAGTTLHLTAVSMGNPHAVTLVEDVDNAEVAKIGPLIEAHALFPRRVNAGFMQVLSPHEIKLRVFERGSGETLSCGSGACAAVVSGIQIGILQSPVLVNTRGGQLNIVWSGSRLNEDGNAVMMTGPAEIVFEGQIDI